MTPTLEIIIPVHNPGEGLARTASSLAAQADRRFEVLLSDNQSEIGHEHLGRAVKLLGAAGIAVRLLKVSAGLRRIEHWNLAHSQAQADWLKPLPAGEILKPEYVAQLRHRLEQKSSAQFVRCDAQVQTDWGIETVRAPFSEPTISASQIGDYFPARVDWICRAGNMAYNRLAWLGAGGYSNQLPGFASLNLNVTLALHHGLENIGETLVKVESPERLPLDESRGERINFPLELWLVLRQARNYCLATGLPWRCRWPWRRALLAGLGHW